MTLCLLVALLVIWTAPHTLVGKCLRRALVEWPADRLARVTCGGVFFGIALVAAGAVSVLLLKGDGARMFGMVAPDLVVWFTTFELSTYVDVLLALSLISANAWIRAALRSTQSGIGFARRVLSRRIAVRLPRTASRHREPSSRKELSRKSDSDDVPLRSPRELTLTSS